VSHVIKAIVLASIVLIALFAYTVYAGDITGFVIGNVPTSTIENLSEAGVTNILFCNTSKVCTTCSKLLGSRGYVLIVMDDIPIAIVYPNANVSLLNISSLSPQSSIIPVIKNNSIEYVSKTPYQNFIICIKKSVICSHNSSNYYLKSIGYVLIGTVVLVILAYYYDRRERRDG
jgi:hypothetical protein